MEVQVLWADRRGVSGVSRHGGALQGAGDAGAVGAEGGAMSLGEYEDLIVKWMKGRGWVSRGAIRENVGFAGDGRMADRIGPAVNLLVRQGVVVRETRNHVCRLCLAGERDSVPDFSPWSFGRFGVRPPSEDPKGGEG